MAKKNKKKGRKLDHLSEDEKRAVYSRAAKLRKASRNRSSEDASGIGLTSPRWAASCSTATITWASNPWWVVISVASSAYATPHSLTLLSLDVLSWDTDLVILSHNINDLQAAYMPGFKPDYSHKYQLHVPSLTPPTHSLWCQRGWVPFSTGATTTGS